MSSVPTPPFDTPGGSLKERKKNRDQPPNFQVGGEQVRGRAKLRGQGGNGKKLSGQGEKGKKLSVPSYWSSDSISESIIQ